MINFPPYELTISPSPSPEPGLVNSAVETIPHQQNQIMFIHFISRLSHPGKPPGWKDKDTVRKKVYYLKYPPDIYPSIVIMETQYSSLSDRIQSMFIDVLFLVMIMFIAASILDRFETVPDWVRISLFVGIFLIYEPVCVSLGCTLGQSIKKLRVRQFGNESKKINILLSVVRYVVKSLLGWLSFLTIHSSKEKRAIHDFAAGSVMIVIP